MNRIYHVDPNDTAEITPGANTPPWREGETYDVPGHGRRAVAHEPPGDLYAEDDQRSDPPGNPSHYVTIDVLAFVNPPTRTNDAARVRATSQHDRIGLDALLAARKQELTGIVGTVDAQGYTLTLSSGERTVITTERAIRQYQNLVLSKDPPEGWPDTLAVKTKDKWDDWYPLTKGDCRTILTALPVYHEAVIGANAETHDDELDRLYAVAEPLDPASPEYAAAWDDLATYDLSTGWPPAPTAPAGKSAGAAFVDR